MNSYGWTVLIIVAAVLAALDIKYAGGGLKNSIGPK